MPEHQASSSQPPPLHSPDPNNSTDRADDTAPPPPETAKRTYLSLLPPPQLIDLILAFDADRQTRIFPHDLDSAIKALQRPHRAPSPSPAKDPPAPAASVVVKAEPVAGTVPPASASTTTTAPVQPPQYTPPAPYYPYTHTPYYPPVPMQRAPHVSPPAPPARNPLFTSAPLNRDPNKPAPAPHVPPPPPPPVSSRDDPNAMPSYEEMIVAAIMDVGDGDGTAPKVLFAWMASHYPLQQNFRPSASQALHKALKRGRLEKLGGKYRLNPSWGGGPTTSKRATRRPTANRGPSPHAPLTNAHPRPPPHPGYTPSHMAPHPPYGFPPYMHHHPSLPVPTWSVLPVPEDDEGIESEDMEAQEEQEDGDAPGEVEVEVEAEAEAEETGKEATCAVDGQTEEIRTSLLRLAKVLKRIARKGGAG